MRQGYPRVSRAVRHFSPRSPGPRPYFTVMVTVRTVERPVLGFTVMVTRHAPARRPFTDVPVTLHRVEVAALTLREIFDPGFTVILASFAIDALENDFPLETVDGIMVVVVVVVAGVVVVVVGSVVVTTVVDEPGAVEVVVGGNVVATVVVVARAETPPRSTDPTVAGVSSSPMDDVFEYPRRPSAPSPQHFTAPDVRTTHVWSTPVATATAVPPMLTVPALAGVSSSPMLVVLPYPSPPLDPAPQQVTAPVDNRAHVW